jgi:hypothetical protein
MGQIVTSQAAGGGQKIHVTVGPPPNLSGQKNSVESYNGRNVIFGRNVTGA